MDMFAGFFGHSFNAKRFPVENLCLLFGICFQSELGSGFSRKTFRRRVLLQIVGV